MHPDLEAHERWKEGVTRASLSHDGQTAPPEHVYIHTNGGDAHLVHKEAVGKVGMDHGDGKPLQAYLNAHAKIAGETIPVDFKVIKDTKMLKSDEGGYNEAVMTTGSNADFIVPALRAGVIGRKIQRLIFGRHKKEHGHARKTKRKSD